MHRKIYWRNFRQCTNKTASLRRLSCRRFTMSEFKEGDKFASIFVGEIYGWNWADCRDHVGFPSSSINFIIVEWYANPCVKFSCVLSHQPSRAESRQEFSVFSFQFSVSCSRELISIQPKICHRQLKIHNKREASQLSDDNNWTIIVSPSHPLKPLHSMKRPIDYFNWFACYWCET